MTETQGCWIITIAIVSVVAACWGVWLSRKTARQQATLNFFAEYNNNSRVSCAFQVIRKEREQFSFSEKEERSDFLFLMNKFETLAIGLKNNIYDKKMVRDAFGRDLKEIYNKSKPWINYIRNNESDSDAFNEFEKLAEKTKTNTTIS